MYIGLILLLAIVATGFGFYLRQRASDREEERSRLSIDELNRRIQRGEKMSIVDLRHPLDVLAAPQLIPGAIPISPQDFELRMSEIPKDAEVVLYCTCPDESSSLNAYRKMKNRGFTDVKVLTGGLPAWKKAHLPLQDLYPELEQMMRQRASRS